MPENPTALSPHVQRLRDEGYAVNIFQDKYIVVDNVPYVTETGGVARGSIISAYYYKDGKENLGDHTVLFTGSVPYTAKGESLETAMVADKNVVEVAGLRALCRFSYKSSRLEEMLANSYNKLTHYIRKLQGYANVIDSTASASAKGSIAVRQERSVFFYPNTAIARAGLDAYEEKLKLPKVAIIGLGGTGSYILDAMAKTPVEEIHLYDDDFIEPATVYRMPAALTYEDAHKKVLKTEHHKEVYSRMRTGIVSHPTRINQANVHELDDCKFVFISVDDGPSRGLIARHLVEKGIPFVDTGMGVNTVPETTKLISRLRVTSIDSESKALIDTLPIADDKDDAVYNNIQVVELNAMNAMLAVIVYKQKIGFYPEECIVNPLHYIPRWQQIVGPEPHEDKNTTT